MHDLVRFPPQLSQDLYIILANIIKKDRDNSVKITAIRTLARLNRKEYSQAMIAALDDSSMDVQEAAITAIQKLKIEKAANPLQRLLEGRDFTRNQKITTLLINTLGLLENGKRSFHFLEKKFKDATTDSEIKATIALFFGKIKDIRAENCLIDTINEDTETTIVRSYALSSLGKIRSQKAVPHIRTILEKAQNPKNKYERQKYAPLKLYAMSALVTLGDNNILQDLIAYAKDDNPSIRIRAIKQLGDLNDKSVIELLEYKAKKDPHRRVRLIAKQVLKKIQKQTKKSQTTKDSNPIHNIKIDDVEEKPARKILPKSGLVDSFESSEAVGRE